jgi:hypothetical protein
MIKIEFQFHISIRQIEFRPQIHIRRTSLQNTGTFSEIHLSERQISDFIEARSFKFNSPIKPLSVSGLEAP